MFSLSTIWPAAPYGYRYPSAEALERETQAYRASHPTPSLQELAADAAIKSLSTDVKLANTISQEVYNLALECKSKTGNIVTLNVHNFQNRGFRDCTINVSVDERISDIYSKILFRMSSRGIPCTRFQLHVPDITYKGHPLLHNTLLSVDPQKTLRDYGIFPGSSAIYAEWHY